MHDGTSSPIIVPGPLGRQSLHREYRDSDVQQYLTLFPAY